MNMRNTAILGTVIASLLSGGIATTGYAQQADETVTARQQDRQGNGREGRGDGRRPVSQIAADLGVTPDQFRECFADVRPARGERPSAERQEANKAILLPCLQKANAEITNDKLDEVMDKYRPEGRQHARGEGKQHGGKHRGGDCDDKMKRSENI
jgi:hypothetical protein